MIFRGISLSPFSFTDADADCDMERRYFLNI